MTRTNGKLTLRMKSEVLPRFDIRAAPRGAGKFDVVGTVKLGKSSWEVGGEATEVDGQVQVELDVPKELEEEILLRASLVTKALVAVMMVKDVEILQAERNLSVRRMRKRQEQLAELEALCQEVRIKVAIHSQEIHEWDRKIAEHYRRRK